MATPVSVSVVTHDDIPVALVRGEVDLSNVADVRSAIATAVTNATRALVIDLSETAYMDSRGVHLLFEIAERMTRTQQQLVVVVPEQAPIRRLLTITHFDSVAPIDDTVADALARFRERP